MYGYDVQAVDDPCVKAADQSNLLASRLLLPGVSFVNAFPVLRHIPPWFPGAFTAKTAKRAKELTQEVIRVPMDNLKQRMASSINRTLYLNITQLRRTIGRRTCSPIFSIHVLGEEGHRKDI